MKTDRSVNEYFQMKKQLANELEISLKRLLIGGETLIVVEDPTSFLGGYKVLVKGEGYDVRMKVGLAALSATQSITDWFRNELIKVREE